jgi:hypothetical protein
VQQVREHQARRASADDADLCAMNHLSAPLSSKFIPLLAVLGEADH